MSLVIANSVWLRPFLRSSLACVCLEFCPTNNELWLTEPMVVCRLLVLSSFICLACVKLKFLPWFSIVWWWNQLNWERTAIQCDNISATMCNTLFFFASTINFRSFCFTALFGLCSLNILLCVSVFCNDFFVSSNGRSELFVRRSYKCVCVLINLSQ